MPFLCDVADFDGTNDYQSYAGALTGLADGKQGTFSLWFRMDGGDNATQRIFSLVVGGANRFVISRFSTNVIRVAGLNAASGTILLIESAGTVLAGATWHHLAVSWNLAVPGSAQLYLDGASSLSETTYTDDTIDYAAATVSRIGALGTDASGKFNGCMAELWFNDSRVDLSASLTAFRSSGGFPVDLGADGSTPIGSQPVVYCHIDDGGDVTDFAVNLGTGEDFTIVGTLATSDTSPSDGQEPVADFSGDPLTGTVPFTVTFTDLTTNSPTSWAWDFGDSGTSTDQNPTHEDTVAGTYDVELTATSNAGTDAETKTSYITASAAAESTDAPRGNAGAIYASWEKARPRRRTEEEVQADRERFGLPAKVDAAIEEVIARQEQMDAEEQEAALREELKLKRIQFRTKYLEAMAARMQANIQTVQAGQLAEQQKRNAQIIMLISAAAVS